MATNSAFWSPSLTSIKDIPICFILGKSSCVGWWFSNASGNAYLMKDGGWQTTLPTKGFSSAEEAIETFNKTWGNHFDGNCHIRLGTICFDNEEKSCKNSATGGLSMKSGKLEQSVFGKG